MATIAISDLRPVGYDLFSDSESYLNDLSENEVGNIGGGASPSSLTITTTWICVGTAVSVIATGAGISYLVGRL
ncbi:MULTISPECIES: hypothetical protein [unclassified Nodularia (in: cyanobacteria)]|uniref:hypothetical protein n=1 Tax=unclassified Nodularia (in: cyanobacteria) TaxID=2656917 RepID=UPI0018817F01|nr:MULTISPECIES: hypothetical protein [unclassified Nodularia (in: cyanobacteria)]MBE9197506.1 hypothetical protein [Nodularia sp. LEGE 06071]MCC2694381.1 hypothetical protein [Nodularia sp. LEGE 04288]